jgi:hypothetical protein
MPDTRRSLSVALCALLIGVTTACGTAPARALLALIGAVIGTLGLVHLGRGDWAWDMHEQGQRARGIVNLERTDEWESWRIISGGLMVICATVIVIIALAV